MNNSNYTREESRKILLEIIEKGKKRREYENSIENEWSALGFDPENEEFPIMEKAIPCHSCFGTGMDKYEDADCMMCWGDGVVDVNY